ncbi:uncharacterized protein ARMOST_06259 [Armillaria ostoyae]|uniref:Uncharacterized protein n=1 Tax=Armillaria ostoyae TaxID=47428 RepID=A0A284R2J1_ARMOS|nr:uncharacterized protein ARMOST_06259 [Armillaria ostoyae]
MPPMRWRNCVEKRRSIHVAEHFDNVEKNWPQPVNLETKLDFIGFKDGYLHKSNWRRPLLSMYLPISIICGLSLPRESQLSHHFLAVSLLSSDYIYLTVSTGSLIALVEPPELSCVFRAPSLDTSMDSLLVWDKPDKGEESGASMKLPLLDSEGCVQALQPYTIFGRGLEDLEDPPIAATFKTSNSVS